MIDILQKFLERRDTNAQMILDTQIKDDFVVLKMTCGLLKVLPLYSIFYQFKIYIKSGC